MNKKEELEDTKGVIRIEGQTTQCTEEKWHNDKQWSTTYYTRNSRLSQANPTKYYTRNSRLSKENPTKYYTGNSRLSQANPTKYYTRN